MFYFYFVFASSDGGPIPPLMPAVSASHAPRFIPPHIPSPPPLPLDIPLHPIVSDISSGDGRDLLPHRDVLSLHHEAASAVEGSRPGSPSLLPRFDGLGPSHPMGPPFRHFEGGYAEMNPQQRWARLIQHSRPLGGDGGRSSARGSSQHSSCFLLNCGQFKIELPPVYGAMDNYPAFYQKLIKRSFLDMSNSKSKRQCVQLIQQICRQFQHVPYYHIFLIAFLESIKKVSLGRRQAFLDKLVVSGLDVFFDSLMLQPPSRRPKRQSTCCLHSFMFRISLRQNGGVFFNLRRVGEVVVPRPSQIPDDGNIIQRFDQVLALMDLDDENAPNYLGVDYLDEFSPDLPNNRQRVFSYTVRARRLLGALFDPGQTWSDPDQQAYMQNASYSVLSAMQTMPNWGLPLPFSHFVSLWFSCRTSQRINMDMLLQSFARYTGSENALPDKLAWFVAQEKQNLFRDSLKEDVHAQAKYQNDLQDTLGFSPNPLACNHKIYKAYHSRGPQTVWETFLTRYFTPATVAHRLADHVNYFSYIRALEHKRQYLRQNLAFYQGCCPENSTDPLPDKAYHQLFHLSSFKIVESTRAGVEQTQKIQQRIAKHRKIQDWLKSRERAHEGDLKALLAVKITALVRRIARMDQLIILDQFYNPSSITVADVRTFVLAEYVPSAERRQGVLNKYILPDTDTLSAKGALRLLVDTGFCVDRRPDSFLPYKQPQGRSWAGLLNCMR